MIGLPASADETHWTLMASEDSLITVPAHADSPQPDQPGDAWKAAHRNCPVCDWHWGNGYRRLTPAAWRRRTTALLPLATGARFNQAVRDQLVTALRMHQTGRPNEATYWLTCAERAASTPPQQGPRAPDRRRAR